MGLGKDIYTKAVLQPLANYLIDRNQKNDAEKAAGVDPLAQGWRVRDAFLYGNQYIQTGTNKSKPGSSVDFKTLQRFSVQYDVVRACINRRKRQLNQLKWDIVSEDPSIKPNETQVNKARDQFKHLGGYRVRFSKLLNMMVDDLLVYDALAIYKRPTLGGELYNLKVLDGSTIKLRVDEFGDTPQPPEIAYKQVIRGEVVADFTADEMYYEMMNPRTITPYGLSPLESLILAVSTALKSDLYNMHMLTEGNIPEGLFSMPENWSSDQIKQFQTIWDASLAGNSAATSKLRFVPPGKYERTVKPEDMRYKELQEWLMKKTCMLYEIQPQELGFTETVNKATGEVQQDIGDKAGLAPLAHFFNEIFTDIIQLDLGYQGLAFKFMGIDDKNEKDQAETNEILIRSGQRTVNEARLRDGLEKDPDPLSDKLMVTAGTPTFLDSAQMEADRQAKADAAAAQAQALSDSNNSDSKEDPAKEDTNPKEDTTKAYNPEEAHVQLVTELRAFRKYAVKRINAKKPLRKFESEVLPEVATDEINKRLQKATTAEEARGIFHEFMQDYQVNFLADVATFRESLKKVV